MTNNYVKILLLLSGLTVLTGCGAGAWARLDFDGVKYPLSMSAFLYDRDYKVVVKGKELDVVAQFRCNKRFWGLFYSLIPLSNDKEIVAAINREVDKAGGDGIINLSVTASNCKFNSFPVISFAPFMPGCVDSVVMGEIVKLKEKAIVSTSPTANYLPKERIGKALSALTSPDEG
ncbi:MAG: hypothetical protein OEV42_15425 [Deltaproteobacteria bacterium]|nr:hypothetical protein [Deltaproteobacteria bacterium]